MQWSVESWAPDYGVALDESHLEETAAEVKADIERPLHEWAPIPPASTAAPAARVLFVDGVRRIDARVWIHEEGMSRPAVCATVAAGAVRCQPGAAEVTEVAVARALHAAATSAQPVTTPHCTYEVRLHPADDTDALYAGIHAHMTEVEASVAAEHGADLVVFDGPLRGRTHPAGVGYVKTQQVQYLPDEVRPVLARLQAGERTPVFLVTSGGVSRFSWYLRLPGPQPHPLAGIVRCELAAVGTALAALTRASCISATLPVFASAPHKDARAPQNLYPIAGLERYLRHRQGDPQVLERALRRAAGGSVPTG
jgi:hypothetical protein